MKFAALLKQLSATWARTTGERPVNPEVVLIVGGIAYGIDDVWYAPRQGGTGAICIGEDPR